MSIDRAMVAEFESLCLEYRETLKIIPRNERENQIANQIRAILNHIEPLVEGDSLEPIVLMNGLMNLLLDERRRTC